MEIKTMKEYETIISHDLFEKFIGSDWSGADDFGKTLLQVLSDAILTEEDKRILAEALLEEVCRKP